MNINQNPFKFLDAGRLGLASMMLAAAGLWAAPLPAWAITVASVNIPVEQTLGDTTLVLNGAGLRQRFVFQVYVAALYVPQKTHNAQAILDSQSPQLLRLTLLRNITTKALTDALNDGLKANSTETQLAAMRHTIQDFEAFMQTGGEGVSGDQVEIRFNQGKVSVLFKGKSLGEVTDPHFSNALLKVWLGPQPAQESLKQALLGQTPTN